MVIAAQQPDASVGSACQRMGVSASHRVRMAARSTAVAAVLLPVLLYALSPADAAAATAVRHYGHAGYTVLVPCWLSDSVALKSLDAVASFRRVGGNSLPAWRKRLRSRPPGSPPCTERFCVERVRAADVSAAIEADAASRDDNVTDAEIFVLRIANVTLDDSAVYECQIINGGNVSSEVAYAHLIVNGDEEPPLVPEVWKEGAAHFLEDAPTSVCCSLPTTPTLKVTWLGRWQCASEQESQQRDDTHIYSCLSLTPSRLDDARRLTCEAKNSVGVTQRSIVIRLAYAPRRVSIDEGSRVFVTEGKQLSVTCRADSYPEPEFSWIVPTGAEHALKKDTFGGSSSTLTLSNVGRRMNGKVVTCSVSNSVTRANRLPPVTRNATLDVRYAPSKPIITFYGRRTVAGRDIQIVEGDRITLYCRADRGNPATEPMWSKDSLSLIPLGIAARQGRLTPLTLKSVKSDDSGVYYCGYSNWLGMSVSTGRHIQVIARPFERTLTNASSTSNANVTGLSTVSMTRDASPDTNAAESLCSSARVRRSNERGSAKGSSTSRSNSANTSSRGGQSRNSGKASSRSSSSGNSSTTTAISTSSSSITGNVTTNIITIRNRNQNRVSNSSGSSSSTNTTTTWKPGNAFLSTGRGGERRLRASTPSGLLADNVTLSFTTTVTANTTVDGKTSPDGETSEAHAVDLEELSSADEDLLNDGGTTSTTDSLGDQSTGTSDVDAFDTTTDNEEEICVE